MCFVIVYLYIKNVSWFFYGCYYLRECDSLKGLCDYLLEGEFNLLLCVNLFCKLLMIIKRYMVVFVLMMEFRKLRI